MKLGPTDVALVTGGGSGLGEATVRRLAAAGAGVVICDLPQSAGKSIAEELGERVVFVPTDVTDEAAVAAALDAAAELGELRVVVTCAGIATPGRIVGRKGPLPLGTFRQVIEVNLIGTFNVLRLAAERMIGLDALPDGDRGVVVMTASIAAYDGQVGQAAYASSKGGIVGLTLTAARDLADKGIRVVTIAPGTMETPMLAGLPEEARTALEQQVPHPARLGRPSEYAALVAHIIDNQLLNGEVIRLDGALRMPPR
ncbi:NAD(P)-dependent dehydrogenase (short-subunit alcohol dehydrogenase family) [Kribbella sp. VKM Ac-2527]|uniref:NAD(P)-dependent dehydrogenase (Short-subunit alcohol dehydrogenase family) n=1 Tax=Kribbella caucasensis TaxID=2512215 RepID=A0A4R6JEN4_9ACTN|nr:SDR family NAD(P)-dependent oxidoreductase [Kribbella sp. VKM Ac-2527]TDO34319.1 NAD(P)-dependent dehydrogenase (short-subunit alcohol dehydrogenase family) [Kribbella sp. VKM Ac-2527]